MNILITSASRKVSLVKAFQQALAQEGGGKVITIDISPLSAALYHGDSAYLVPESSEETFIPTLQQLCQREEIKLIVPSRDEELPLFARSRRLFKKTGVEVMVPDLEIVETCQNKKRFIDFCGQRGFPVPKTYSEEELEKKPDFPMFIKGCFGKSAKDTFKVENQAELDYLLNHFGEVIVQEYIPDEEFTIDLFADFAGNIISVVPRRRISVLGGESFIGKTCKNETLMDAAINLARALGLTGHNTIQCFFDGGKVKFIEVNPRFGGGVNLSFAAGANTPLYLIQLVEGKKVESKIGQFKDGLIMLRYTEDTFIDKNTADEVPRFDQSCNL